MHGAGGRAADDARRDHVVEGMPGGGAEAGAGEGGSSSGSSRSTIKRTL